MTNSVAKTIWDCLIIGAGPSGALAALQIARQGKTVLLVDKAIFPRHKVCGCCINNSAFNILKLANVDHLVTQGKAISVNSLRLFNDGLQANMRLENSFSMSREKFDLSLIDAAIAAGVKFVSETSAVVVEMGSLPVVQLSEINNNFYVKSRLVIVADGLNGKSLALFPQFDSLVQNNSRFGAGTILGAESYAMEPGTIFMSCGQQGYVGMVMLEDRRINVAAAFDIKYSRQCKGAGHAAAKILQENGLGVPSGLQQSHWLGTEFMTRKRRHIAGERLFIIGDACAYAEPFTGEGIAWALASGYLVSDLALQAIEDWEITLIKQWQRKQKTLRKLRERSYLIAASLRHSICRSLLLKTSVSLPELANYFARLITSGEIELKSC